MALALRELLFGCLFSTLLIGICRLMHVAVEKINAWQAVPGAPPDPLYRFFILIVDAMGYGGFTIIIGLYTYKGILTYAEELGFRKGGGAKTVTAQPAPPVPLPRSKAGSRARKG